MPEQTEPLSNDPNGTGDPPLESGSAAVKRVQIFLPPVVLWGLVGLGGSSMAAVHLAVLLVNAVSDRIDAGATTEADLLPVVVVMLMHGLVLMASALAATLWVLPVALVGLAAKVGGDDARRALGLAPRGNRETRGRLIGPIIILVGVSTFNVLTRWAENTGSPYLHGLSWLSMWLPLGWLYLKKLEAVLYPGNGMRSRQSDGTGHLS